MFDIGYPMLSQKTKILSSILAVTACVVLVFLMFTFKFLSIVDSQLQDKLFIKENISEKVVIIGIDNKSIQQIGQWPWNRAHHGKMIEKLESIGVAAIGYDVTFSESGYGDEQFFKSLEKSKKLVFPLEGEIKLAKNIMPEFTEVLWPVSQIKDNFLIGHTGLIPDKDGKIRKTFLNVNFQDQIIKPFFLQILGAAGYLSDNIDLNDYRFDEYGLFRIKFLGPSNTITQYSFIDVLQEDFDSTLLENKIVLVGAVANNLHDEYFTASTAASPMSGVEIQAHLIDSFLQNKFLSQINNTQFYILLFVILGILAGLCAFKFKLRFSIPLVFAMIFMYLILTIILLEFGFLISILYPILLIILIYAVSFLVKYLLEQKEKQKLRSSFSQYAAKEVVDEIVAHPEKLNLGGERKKMSILFSDIRSFTSISEDMQPEDLVHFLNQYLTEMTEIILDKNGVVDKFIGDAVMALWGAPLPNAKHAYDAVCSALIMQERLKDFNKKMKQSGRKEIEIGIGINTGDVVVGNLGSQQRFDYTVIGDPVNLASRLEGLTKYYGASIIISEHTEKELKNKFCLRYLDKVAVKGKKQGIKIYQVLDFVQNKKQYQEYIDDFSKATDLYLNQQWQQAYQIFKKLLEKYKHDKLAEIYFERLEEYVKSPPTDFDGVFRAEFK